MDNYNDLLKAVLKCGTERDDRTGVGTIGLFAEQLKFDLQAGFPAVTSKKLAWKSVVSELQWFIEGSGDERRLAEIHYGTRDPAKRTIWTANAEADYWQDKAKFPGDLGSVYGVQWRSWVSPEGKIVDQLAQLVQGLKKDPNGRRHVLTAWNPGELQNMALPPCHMFAQFYMRDNMLSCQMYQRSADLFLGVPFNIASYALLTHLLAKTIGAEADRLILTFGDVHIYKNHLDAVNEQLSRSLFPLPTLDISGVKDVFSPLVGNCNLVGYQSHSTIKAEMAV